MTAASTARQLHGQWKQSLTSRHGRFLNLAAVAGLFYLLTWLPIQYRSILSGGSSVIISLAFLFLGFRRLWQNRHDLQQRTPTKDDRMAGHLLIICGAFWLPFSRYSVSLQAFIWMLILVGVAWSSFGLTFFGRYAAATLLILLGMYPSSTFLANRIVNAVIEPRIFELLVARWGSQALGLIGQEAIAKHNLILLGDKTVFVDYPCTGVDMAISLAVLSFVVGLVFNQSAWRILFAMAVGIFIAMTLNIPRVMLMVMAIVYWGQDSFDFWHGPWGGQIFSALMFTIAYYAIEPIYSQNHKTKTKQA